MVSDAPERLNQKIFITMKTDTSFSLRRTIKKEVIAAKAAVNTVRTASIKKPE